MRVVEVGRDPSPLAGPVDEGDIEVGAGPDVAKVALADVDACVIVEFEGSWRGPAGRDVSPSAHAIDGISDHTFTRVWSGG